MVVGKDVHAGPTLAVTETHWGVLSELTIWEMLQSDPMWQSLSTVWIAQQYARSWIYLPVRPTPMQLKWRPISPLLQRGLTIHTHLIETDVHEKASNVHHRYTRNLYLKFQFSRSRCPRPYIPLSRHGLLPGVSFCILFSSRYRWSNKQ